MILFINNIEDFFNAIGSFVNNIIDYLGQILGFITGFFNFISTMISYVIPEPFYTFLVFIIPFIMIIGLYKIIRKG